MNRKNLLHLPFLAVALMTVISMQTDANATGFNGVQWTQIGPAPLQINQEKNYQGAGPDSGVVVDIAVDPRGGSDQTIYIVAGSGGIWKSTDSGVTWTPKTDNEASLFMGAVALDPGNPSIVYAGSGNPAFGGDCPDCNFQSVGILKSIDGGDTWTLLANSPKGVSISRIVFPVPGTLLAATSKGLYRSTDAGSTFSQLSVGGLGNQIDDLRLDTQNPSTTVRAAVQGQGIFISTNIGAASPTFTNQWTNTNGSPLQTLHRTGGINPIRFAQSATDLGNTIYTTVGKNTRSGTTLPNSSAFQGMWVSKDAGSTWTNLPGADAAGDASGSNNSGCQCGYDQTIGVGPTNSQTVYIGFQELYKSTDGGGSFSNISNTKIHWDHHAFTFGPHDATGQTFYVGQDGGVARSTNGGGAFTNINGSTSYDQGAIATCLIRQLDIGRNTDNDRKYSYAGFQDTGNAQFGPGYTGTTWQLGQDGDGGPMTVDPCDATHAISTDDGGYQQTTDGGGSWSGSVTITPAVTAGFSLGGDVFGFDQTCDKTVYAGFNISDPTGAVATTFGLYQSTDNGSNYSQVKSFTTNVMAIATAKIDPNVVWVGLADGRVAYSTDALSGTSSSWTTLADPSGTGQAARGAAIDPINTDTIFVVYPGISGASPSKHIFMTSDRGANWSDISGTGTNGLPDLPLHAVAIDPGTSSAPRTVIVGGDGGVFQSTDNGVNWQVLGLGLPTVGVTSVAIDTSVNPSVLRVGTYGRSSFELSPPTGPLLAINTNLNLGIQCPGSSPTTLLQLFNVGAADLTIKNIQRVSGSGDFTVSGPAFPVTIKPGEEIDWTIKLTVTASSANPETAVFSISSNDSFNPNQQVTYSATVGQPKIGTVIANGGNFGDVCAGTYKDLNLTVTNSGSCALNITGFSFAPLLADFKPASASFPISVEAGNSLPIPIRFQPLSNTSGPESTTVTMLSNDPGVAPKVSLTGNAPPGKIAVSGSGGFDNVCAGSNAQQSITIGNTGPCDLHVTGVAIDNGSGGACPDFTIQINPFPNTLSHDSNLPVTIAFTPTTGGAKNCRLVINSDDPITPVVTVPLTATTPAVNIDVPSAGYNFPATVIQSVGACSSNKPFPVSNNGICPLTINNVAVSGTNGADYSLSGMPSLATPLQPGHILGEGNLLTVFKPTLLPLSRGEKGVVTVTYEDDPITHHQSSVLQNLCGEDVTRGARVLVTAAGVPLPVVDKIQLNRLTSNRLSISVDNAVKVPLQPAVVQNAPCASFIYHREWGGASNPIQLTAGDYQITVTATLPSTGKKVSKTVSFTLGTCSFNQNIVVPF